MDIMFSGGDIDSSLFGDITLVDDDADIVQSCIALIMIRYGELDLHPTTGNTIMNQRIKLSDIGVMKIADACSDAIMQEPRVKSVKSITATKSRVKYGECDISFTILTNSGKQLSSNISLSLL